MNEIWFVDYGIGIISQDWIKYYHNSKPRTFLDTSEINNESYSYKEELNFDDEKSAKKFMEKLITTVFTDDEYEKLTVNMIGNCQGEYPDVERLFVEPSGLYLDVFIGKRPKFVLV